MAAMTHDNSTIDPLAQARSTHVHLLRGGRLRPIADFPFLERAVDERTLSVRTGLTYARLWDATPQIVPGGTTVIAGPVVPPVVAGYLIGSTIRTMRERRARRKQSGLQWHTSALWRTALTTHRLWVELPGGGTTEWVRFNHETITSLTLAGDRLELHFAQAPPLALAGPWAPWCAAVIAHFRYGQDAVGVLPALNSGGYRG